MKLVFICSPYRSDNPDPHGRAVEILRNIQMARTGCRIAVERGMVPFAPHLFYPQFLSEETERETGIKMGMQMLSMCEELWVLGRKVTDGMTKEISYARELGIPVRIIEKAKSSVNTSKAVYDAWYDAVYMPPAAPEEEEQGDETEPQG